MIIKYICIYLLLINQLKKQHENKRESNRCFKF